MIMSIDWNNLVQVVIKCKVFCFLFFNPDMFERPVYQLCKDIKKLIKIFSKHMKLAKKNVHQSEANCFDQIEIKIHPIWNWGDVLCIEKYR